jgi:hypothetical protein
MQDMLAKAESWFEQQRREHLAVEVQYRPAGTLLPRTCRATLVVGRWESVDSAGQLVRMESLDFFIHKDELPADPKKGDRIAVTEQGVEKLYEVAIIGGASYPWSWADRSQKIRRIRTMAVAGTTAIPNETLLVRAVGSSTAAEITDAQIKTSLSLDMAQSRAIEKTVVASSAYLYVVLPVSFGEPVLRVNGFLTTAWGLTLRNIAFDGQASRPYRIYRSTYPITGTAVVEIS